MIPQKMLHLVVDSGFGDKLLDILYPLNFAAEKEGMFLSLANDKLCLMVGEKIGGVGLEGYVFWKGLIDVFTIEVRESKAQHTLSQGQDGEGRIRMLRGF